MRRALLVVLTGILFAGLSGCGSAGTGHTGPRSRTIKPAVPLGAPGRASFISLWPACACGRKTLLDQFSLRDGRRLRTLTRVQVAWPEMLATPSVDRRGDVWMTFSSGPRCSSGTAGCGPVPGSCAGRVLRLNPHSGTSRTVLSFSNSESVRDAIPSPDATRVVLVEGGCTSAFFNQHLVVRNLASGRQWSIGADAAPCHALGAPAWNPSGRRLVFPYGPSVLSGNAHPTPGTCEASRFNRLAIVSARHGSRSSSWKLIKAQHGCSYQAATFDRRGVAAVEGCVQGEPPGQYSVNQGYAFLVQLNHRGRITRRLALQRAWDGGSIATERNGNVLVSQYKPTRSDWVWQFNGHVLRLVARYRAQDAPQVIAVPTAAR